MQSKLVNSFFFLFHVGAIAALFYFSWKMLFLAMVVWYISGSWGIGIGFHRLHTHKSFKTYKWVGYLQTTFGHLSLQGPLIWWVAVHREHHLYTEQSGLDPHTPRDGKFWSHMGWLIFRKRRHYEPSFLERFAPELQKDLIYVWLSRFSLLPIIVWGIFISTVCGFKGLLWGVAVPVVLGWHFTWLVNSATHLWGSQPYITAQTGDSRNNWWVAMLTFGEGWHNNHHAKPTSARHGFKWYQVDVNWYGIKFLKFLGLAWNVKEATN